VRDLVLVEELAQLERLLRVRVADDADADEPRGLEQLAAKLEGLEQLVAQVGALVEELADPRGGNLVDLRRAARDGRDERRAPRQHADVPRELPRPVDDDLVRLAGRALQDHDLARAHGVEREVHVADVDEDVAVLEGSRLPELGHATELDLGQRGERRLAGAIAHRLFLVPRPTAS
jgi:hypothetical protein